VDEDPSVPLEGIVDELLGFWEDGDELLIGCISNVEGQVVESVRKARLEEVGFSRLGYAADVGDAVLLQAGQIATGLIGAEIDGGEDLLCFPSHLIVPVDGWAECVE